MTKILLLNDTSKYHNGCVKVVEQIKDMIPVHRSLKRCPDEEILKYDYVVLNGEGTMHHDAREAINFMKNLEFAQSKGIRTAIINSVWQDVNAKWIANVLHNCEYISVREVLSQEELWKAYSIDAEVYPDLSFFADVPEESFPHKERRIGMFFNHFPYGKNADVNIFKSSWNDIVNTLRNTDLFITGRHHDMYAALKAECPMVLLSGNTWKNEGLMKTAGVDIPVLSIRCNTADIERLSNVALDKYGDQYEKLFKFMRTQTAPDLMKKLSV